MGRIRKWIDINFEEEARLMDLEYDKIVVNYCVKKFKEKIEGEMGNQAAFKKFEVGQTAFSTVHGSGVIVRVEQETENDLFPVEFAIDGDKEVIEFFSEFGQGMEGNLRSLFHSKEEALSYLGNVKVRVNHVKVFNFYENGEFSFHKTELDAKDYLRATSRVLVKMHKVEWSVLK